MVRCYILRKSGTLKIQKIKDRENSFTFENGKYFILKDRMFLKKVFLKGYVASLFYIEGISEPLKLDNIQKQKIPQIDDNGNNVLDDNGKIKMVDDETVLISAKNIHDLTSAEMLSVLTGGNLTRLDKLLLGLLALNIIITIGVGMV